MVTEISSYPCFVLHVLHIYNEMNGLYSKQHYWFKRGIPCVRTLMLMKQY